MKYYIGDLAYVHDKLYINLHYNKVLNYLYIDPINEWYRFLYPQEKLIVGGWKLAITKVEI